MNLKRRWVLGPAYIRRVTANLIDANLILAILCDGYATLLFLLLSYFGKIANDRRFHCFPTLLDLKDSHELP